MIGSRLRPAQRRHPPPRTVAEFLEWSFDVLREDLPEGFRAFCSGLNGLRVLLLVDAEWFTVDFTEQEALVVATSTDDTFQAHRDDRKGSATLTTTRSVILDVIDAKLTLQDAVQNQELGVVASLDQLDTLSIGLNRYVHCGVRCARFPMILQSFRSFHQYQRN